MAICTQGYIYVAMAENFLHYFWMNAGEHEQGGAGVTQVMNSNVANAGLLQNPVQDFPQRVGVIGIAVFTRKNEIQLFIIAFGFVSDFFLPFLVIPQD